MGDIPSAPGICCASTGSIEKELTEMVGTDGGVKTLPSSALLPG